MIRRREKKYFKYQRKWNPGSDFVKMVPCWSSDKNVLNEVCGIYEEMRKQGIIPQ